MGDFKSILTEINRHVPEKNKDDVIASRANHIIVSAINLLELIKESYSEEDAAQLEKRFYSSIKNADAKKFKKCISVIKESKNENT